MVRGLNLISCCSQQRIRSLIPTRMFCADVRRVVLRAVLRAAARACWRRVLARCVPRAPYCVLRLALLCERAGARAPRSQRSAHRLVVRCLDARAHRSGLSSPTARCGRSHRALANSKLGLCASGMDACSAHSEPLSWRPQACPRGARFSAPSTASLVRVTLLPQTSAENG